MAFILAVKKRDGDNFPSGVNKRNQGADMAIEAEGLLRGAKMVGLVPEKVMGPNLFGGGTISPG